MKRGRISEPITYETQPPIRDGWQISVEVAAEDGGYIIATLLLVAMPPIVDAVNETDRWYRGSVFNE